MFTLLTCKQKFIVILIWIAFLGNILLAICNMKPSETASEKRIRTLQRYEEQRIKRQGPKPLNPLEETDSAISESSYVISDLDNQHTRDVITKKEMSASIHIDINTAQEDELRLLPGIGSVLAKAIVAWRKQHGPFMQIEDMKQVPGIGPKKFETLQAHVFIDPKSSVKPLENKEQTVSSEAATKGINDE